MTELLLEVRSADLPAGQAGSAVRRLKENLVSELRRRELGPRQSGVGYTPRRLIVMLRGLPAEESRDELRSTLVEIVPEVVTRLKWPQAPSWDGRGQWPRPINGVLCLFDGEVLEVEIAGVMATDQTVGHAFLSPEPVAVENAADFARRLQSRGVELRPAERKKLIRAGLESIAKDLLAAPILSEGQLERMADECEVPGVFSGQIDPELVELPRELVIAFLELRQGAIALERDGQLLPRFVVATDRADDPEGRVRHGHEVSVRAHLEEMRSLWLEDLAIPLAERYRALADSEYGVDLGSWRDKAGRVADLAESFCRELDLPGEASMAAEAARLLKADLECELVREIPSLAGTVGGLLAREEGYPESVWQAIADQYRPSETLHTVPRGRVGKITALADRLDALVGCFVVGSSSTGGPARRRLEVHADAALEILVAGRLGIDLDLASARAVRRYAGSLQHRANTVLSELRTFLDDRLRMTLSGRGFSEDELNAVLDSSGSRLLPDVLDRLEGIQRWRSDPRLERVVRGARRVLQVIRDAPEGRYDSTLLQEPSERSLLDALDSARRLEDSRAGDRRSGDESESRLGTLTTLVDAVESFFSQVLVRDENEDLRFNRLAMLQAVHRVLSRPIRFAEIELQSSSESPKKGSSAADPSGEVAASPSSEPLSGSHPPRKNSD